MESVLQKLGGILPQPPAALDQPAVLADTAPDEKLKAEQLIVLQYLMELEKMKETDPAKFSQALRELGLEEPKQSTSSSSSGSQIASLRYIIHLLCSFDPPHMT